MIVTHRLKQSLFALPALIFFTIFFIYPLIEIARVSFVPSILSQGESPFTILRNPVYLRVLGFTFWQATLSTVLTLAAGLPLAFAFARYRFVGHSFWRALATIPFVLPTVVVAAAFNALIGSRGAFNELLQRAFNLDSPPIQILGTFSAILLAHIFFNVSVVIRIVGASLTTRDPQLEEAAATDGANRWEIFSHITLPLILPSIGAAAILTFLFCFASFGVALLLGGVQFVTLEVEIYKQTAQLLRLDIATSLALLQLAVTLVLSVMGQRLQEYATAQEQNDVDVRQPAKSLRSRLFIASALTFVAVFIALPLAALVIRSLDLDGEWFHFYNLLPQNTRGSFFFVSPLVAIRNSLAFAVMSMFASMAMGASLAYALSNRSVLSRIGEALLLLPIGTSAVTLGLGFLVSLGAFSASIVLTPIAHTMIALPFVVRALLPAIRSLDPQLRESAMTEGAGGFQTFRQIELPLLAPMILSVAVFAFSISLGEFGVSLILSRPEFPTLPVAIFRYLGQPGATNYGQAMAMSVILMIVMAASAMTIEKIGGWKRMMG